MSYYLGICSNVHISSAALCRNGEIVAAAAEERFIREKYTRKFPINSITYCLNSAGIKIENIEKICVANDVGINLNRYDYRLVEVLRNYGEIATQIPMALSKLTASKYVGPFEQKLNYDSYKMNLKYIPHHKAHMANAFFMSPFKQAAIISVDGYGEDGTTFWAVGDNNCIQTIKKLEYPHSVGMLYGTITELLGYRHDRDEWKVMGMAAFGTRNNQYYYKLRQCVHYGDDGSFQLNLKYFNFYSQNRDSFYNMELFRLLGCPVQNKGEFTQNHYDIAAAIQQLVEEILANMLNFLYCKTKCENLVVSGGVFMNSLFNAKIKKLTPFKNVYFTSCPDDSGLSIGAALQCYYDDYPDKKRVFQSTNYFGPEYSGDAICECLNKYKLSYERSLNVFQDVAKILAEGKVVGWFQGRMEFGQRALGNRSILADPRNARMKDKINACVKYREGFRPFAPAILDDDLHLYTDACVDENRFMSQAVSIQEDMISKIPAVVHKDGTARIQCVSRESNERLYLLISEFKRVSGVGVLLNTSFNVQGEPIVCSPTDAIRTFFASGLDVLVLGDYIVNKEK